MMRRRSVRQNEGVEHSDGEGRSGEVSLRLADISLRPVVERLGQLERHDLSELVGFLPGADGLFDFPRLAQFFTDADHDAYLIFAGGTLAGFCLTRPFDRESTFIHAFFVVRALRRQGVGRAAAVDLLQSRRGRWAIAFLEQNESAARFWREVATELVGDSWTEERRTAADGHQTFTFVHVDVDGSRHAQR